MAIIQRVYHRAKRDCFALIRDEETKVLHLRKPIGRSDVACCGWTAPDGYTTLPGCEIDREDNHECPNCLWFYAEYEDGSDHES